MLKSGNIMLNIEMKNIIKGGALGACVRWAVADMLAPGFVLAIFLCNVF